MESPDRELVNDAIGIFDLMRARPESNDMEEIGLDLYRECWRDKFGLAADRLFILSYRDFLDFLRRDILRIHSRKVKFLEKPFAASQLINRIVKLLPEIRPILKGRGRRDEARTAINYEARLPDVKAVFQRQAQAGDC